MAVAASLAIHVGVAGLALGHALEPAPRWEPVIAMEMLPAAAGPTLEPPPVTHPIEPLPAAPLRSPLLMRRARPAAGQQRELSTSAMPASAASGSDSAPHFNVTLPSIHDAAPARFVLPIAHTLVSTASGARELAGSGAAEDTFAASDVAVPARLVASAAVVYPIAARAAEVETDVAVEIVIDTRGRVIEARSLVTPGYGLDQAALRAVRAYQFSPAQRRGRPVRVRMRWNVQFRLR